MDRHDTDPVPLADSLARLHSYLGTAAPSALSALEDSWDQLLGEPLASRTRLHSLRAGTLVVATSDPAVGEQLRWLTAELVAAANELVGCDVVDTVSVRVVAD